MSALSKRLRSSRGKVALTAALAIGSTLVMAPLAVAAPAAQSAAVQNAAVQPSYRYVCVVPTNGVKYRTGPGTEYRALGTVNAGQKMNVFGGYQNPRDGWWQHGDLWGGPQGVWIRQDVCH
jgi:uncharacterized protein YgiM (DUF1202 family)